MDPITRKEMYLAYMTGEYTGEIPEPITRIEHYLYNLCVNGTSSGGDYDSSAVASLDGTASTYKSVMRRWFRHYGANTAA